MLLDDLEMILHFEKHGYRFENVPANDWQVKVLEKQKLLLVKETGAWICSWRFANGGRSNVTFVQHDRFHRPASDGPSQIYWYRSGEVDAVIFSEDGLTHRPSQEGPAYFKFSRMGGVEVRHYLKGNAVYSADEALTDESRQAYIEEALAYARRGY